MYLHRLGNEQKMLFLELAQQFVYVDEVFSEHEKQVIKAYCQEMGIDNIDCKPGNKAETIEKVMNICSKDDGKIIIFELIGLGLIDGMYDSQERKFVSEISKIIGITDEYCNACEIAINDYMNIQERFNRLVIS